MTKVNSKRGHTTKHMFNKGMRHMELNIYFSKSNCSSDALAHGDNYVKLWIETKMKQWKTLSTHEGINSLWSFKKKVRVSV